MRKNNATMELVAGYNTYAGAEDLNVSAISDTPATTPWCILISFSVVGPTVSQL